MRGRRARHRPPRWFHRTRYVAANGQAFQVVHAVDEPRFPLPDLARSAAVLLAGLPFGVLGAVLLLVATWWLLSWGWGL